MEGVKFACYHNITQFYQIIPYVCSSPSYYHNKHRIPSLRYSFTIQFITVQIPKFQKGSDTLVLLVVAMQKVTETATNIV